MAQQLLRPRVRSGCWDASLQPSDSFRPIEDITDDGVTGCHAIRVVTMCIHHGMVLTHRTHGNISTNAGTPISVAGCKRRSLIRSHPTSGTANTIAHSHQSGSQSGYGSQPMRPTAGEMI